MKKLILIILLVSTMNIYSGNIKAIAGFKAEYIVAEYSYLRNSERSMIDWGENLLGFELTSGINIYNFRIIGRIRNTAIPQALDSYNPIQNRYFVDINYSFFDFEIGFSHWCDHPSVANNIIKPVYSDQGRRSFYIAWYKEI